MTGEGKHMNNIRAIARKLFGKKALMKIKVFLGTMFSNRYKEVIKKRAEL
jgi:hypothetical protein